MVNYIMDHPSVISSIIGVIGSIFVGYLAYVGVRKTIKSHYDLQSDLIESQSDSQKGRLIAEQISKSRIDWLKTTREYFSNYISEVNQCWEMNREYNIESDNISEIARKALGGSKMDREMASSELSPKLSDQKELRLKLSELEKRAESDYYKAVFSINPNEEIFIFLEQYLNLSRFTRNIIEPKYKAEMTRIIGKEVQAFFKREWEKAKHEISEGKISEKENIHKNELFSRSIASLNDDSINEYTNLYVLERVFTSKSSECELLRVLYKIKNSRKL